MCCRLIFFGASDVALSGFNYVIADYGRYWRSPVASAALKSTNIVMRMVMLALKSAVGTGAEWLSLGNNAGALPLMCAVYVEVNRDRISRNCRATSPTTCAADCSGIVFSNADMNAAWFHFGAAANTSAVKCSSRKALCTSGLAC